MKQVDVFKENMQSRGMVWSRGKGITETLQKRNRVAKRWAPKLIVTVESRDAGEGG